MRSLARLARRGIDDPSVVRQFRKHQRHQLAQRAPIDIAFEVHNLVHGTPVIDPAPGFEFLRLSDIELKIRVGAHHLQEKPALFLAHTDRLILTSHHARRQSIPQPVASHPEHTDVIGQQAGLLAQLAKERLLWRLILTDTALGKLPGVLPNPLAPEQLPLTIAQDDAYIRSEAITINHLCKPKKSSCRSLFHSAGVLGKATPGERRTAIDGRDKRYMHVQSSAFMSLSENGQKTMRLALFDLDNTLLAGDSDHAWGSFLADIGAVDAETYSRANDAFYAQYLDGTLDIREFCRFVFRPLAQNPLSTLERWREEFLEEQIRPMIAPGATDLLERHRRSGDTLLIITATNSFVTGPIAEMLDVPHLIATEPEFRDGRFTGELAGTPCFQEGKVERLQQWLRAQGQTDGALARACFYSDSRNDIPLLEAVGEPVAVDADPALAAHARHRGWPHISLRSGIAADLQDAPDAIQRRT